MEIKDKGFYFTFDAMVAVILVLGMIVILNTYTLTSRPLEKEIQEYTGINSIGEDAMQLMTYQKLSDCFSDQQLSYFVNNSVLKSDDENLSVIDALAILWAAGNTSVAENLTKTYLQKIIPSDYKYRVVVKDTNNQIIYSSANKTNKSLVSSAKRMISGVKRNIPRTGYVAKVSLSEVEKIENHFSYFGGYVGDGNISLNVSLKNLKNVFDASMELDASNPFKLYINGNYSGNYMPSNENLSADTFLICNETFHPEYCSYISQNNIISLNFSKFPAYVGGGFLKIRYNTTENISITPQNTKIKIRNLPGIHGIINLFSSFYVPGNLNSMEIYLHYNSNYTLFVSIGNVTVFEKNPVSSEQRILLNSSEIFGNLTQNNFSLDMLSNNTVPLRIGFENISSKVENVGADVALVTDVSGSMEWCTDGTEGSFTCTDWYQNGNHLRGERWQNSGCEKKIDVAKSASKLFVNTLLNNSGNRIGLIDYTNNYGGCYQIWGWYYCYVCSYPYDCGWNSGYPGCTIPFPDSISSIVNLTSDNSTLQSSIDSTETWWGTCTCCGVNKALEMLNQLSNSSKFRAIVVLSDGEANEECPEQGTGDAKKDAILAAQTACDQNISVYTVGFGSDADETTLKAMACNDSMYYNATNVDELAQIYQEIGEKIIGASYSAQTVQVKGNFSLNNTLYPDSYLKFNYTPYVQKGFGKISLTQETDKFGGVVESPKNFSFTLPNNTQLLDLKVSSYSSNYWTDRVLIKNQSTENYEYAFKLWDFGTNYRDLGDPYIVQIPVNLASQGQNDIQVDTAINQTQTMGGSPDDRVIYTLLIPGYVPYGNTFIKAEGGTKTFESDLGNFTVKVGNFSDLWDPQNDSLDDAVERLMNSLDTNHDGKIDVKLSTSNINVDSLAIGKIPWMWGPAEIRLEVWK